MNKVHKPATRYLRADRFKCRNLTLYGYSYQLVLLRNNTILLGDGFGQKSS